MEELNVFDKLTAIATPTQLTLFGDSDRSRAIAEHKHGCKASDTNARIPNRTIK